MTELRTTPEERKRLAELERAATPGPMVAQIDPYFCKAPVLYRQVGAGLEFVGRFKTADFPNYQNFELGIDDAKFYAAARNAMPDLLADLAALEAECRRLAGEVERWKAVGDEMYRQAQKLGDAHKDAFYRDKAAFDMLMASNASLAAERDDLARRLAERENILAEVVKEATQPGYEEIVFPEVLNVLKKYGLIEDER